MKHNFTVLWFKLPQRQLLALRDREECQESPSGSKRHMMRLKSKYRGQPRASGEVHISLISTKILSLNNINNITQNEFFFQVLEEQVWEEIFNDR